MYNLKTILIILLSILTGMTCYCQEEFTSLPSGRGQYALVAYISEGPGFFASRKGTPDYLHPAPSKINPVSTIRILWFPDHLLKAGLESGYMTFYSYGISDSAGNKGTIALDAVPLLLEWSMSVTRHFNIFAGPGAYILNTRLNYKGKSSAKKVSVGWMAAASYILPLSGNTGLGAEAKWLYAAETTNGSVCFQLQFVWKFLKW